MDCGRGRGRPFISFPCVRVNPRRSRLAFRRISSFSGTHARARARSPAQRSPATPSPAAVPCRGLMASWQTKARLLAGLGARCCCRVDEGFGSAPRGRLHASRQCGAGPQCVCCACACAVPCCAVPCMCERGLLCSGAIGWPRDGPRLASLLLLLVVCVSLRAAADELSGEARPSLRLALLPSVL